MSADATEPRQGGGVTTDDGDNHAVARDAGKEPLGMTEGIRVSGWRTQRLFDEGFIAGVRAEIAPGPVGLAALVMVGVVLDRSTPESFAAFERAVLELKEVLDCNLVAWDFRYLLKIRVKDMADFNKLHGSKLIALRGVRQSRTFFVVKNVKDNARLPL